MKELKKIVQGFLKSVHPRVSFQNAPEKGVYPYIVYKITQIPDDGEGLRTPIVDIYIWDSPSDGDATVLETLVESINGNGDIINPTGLNKKILSNGATTAVFYLDRVLPPDEDEKRLKYRVCAYGVKLFKRS